MAACPKLGGRPGPRVGDGRLPGAEQRPDLDLVVVVSCILAVAFGQVLLRVLIERSFAARGAEVVGLSLIL